ncbi:MAG TPA: mechanosensitive ion channel domain-containing protein [Candidatus Angelobacter sp.]|nr:mechanosensitive ion channel domain-containing protein [Candidatus Angelobacter sp.]
MKQTRRSCAAVVLLLVAALLLAPLALRAQDQNTPPPNNNGDEIIPFLNQNIIWYRQLAAQQQLATEPSDVLFLNDNRHLADQVVRLAFEYARARAQQLAAGGAASATAQATPAGQFQRLAEATAKADQKVKDLQQEIVNIRRQYETANGKQRKRLEALLAETDAELDLYVARRDALHGMLQFASGAAGGLGSGNLTAQVEELARAVPSAAATAKDAGEESAAQRNSSNATAVATQERRQEPSGILSLVSDLFALRRKIRALDDNLKLTDSLSQSAKSLRAPLLATLRELSQKADQISGQPDSTDPAVLQQQRKQVDDLTQQYKQISASVLPLSKQNILLDVYKRSTTNWRSAVNGEYQSELKGLILRLGGLGVILGIVIGISEVWKRASFRYVTDPRRRYQFLLLRRIVLWIVIAIVVAVAFASELSTITTFAGLLTAGIAVALQNVILSVAGYFFLIGKYGVRVGDRVQVAGVTGDVVDIGLVRLHLMEVTGAASPHPTGRVVVFSNSVVFQANAGLFKQIPGTNFLWHEITLSLSAESNYRDVEKRMLEIVNKVFEEYREKMEMQRRGMERALNSITISAFKPESHLRLTSTGLEIVIRYPVELSNAAEIDDRITRELLAATENEPRLTVLRSASPVLQQEQPAGAKS